MDCIVYHSLLRHESEKEHLIGEGSRWYTRGMRRAGARVNGVMMKFTSQENDITVNAYIYPSTCTTVE